MTRVTSWLTAVEGLRSNIKAIADCEKQTAARLRFCKCLCLFLWSGLS